jgi:hypothetical protein
MKVSFAFTTSPAWYSRVIRWCTKATVSHAFLLLEDTNLGDLVLEAGWDGWRLRPATELVIASVPVPQQFAPAVNAAVVHSIADLGREYDYLGLLGMAWVCLGRALRKKWRQPFRTTQAMFCSDAVVAEILQPVNWPGADTLDAQSVDPDALLLFLQRSVATVH